MRATLVALLAAVLVTTGCSTLPTSGTVHTKPDSDVGAGRVPYFAPPGPTDGDDRAGVVRGFLLAMQANPPSTSVARQFLSEGARTRWQPDGGTVVYNTSTVEAAGAGVSARFTDAHRLDPAGIWEPGAGGSSTSVEFQLVQEDGEWRIDNPPNELAVPASYFSSLFVPFVLYFYDRTGTVLVPRRVYVPRGEQTATNLVRGLLAGPGASLADVATGAFPPRTVLDLAVVVDDAGLAEVPLGPRSLRMSRAELGRVVAQLARTLRQVPGIVRLRITVDGSPLTLANGETDVSVNSGSALDPVVSRSHDVVGILGRRVVRDVSDTVVPLGGPLGAPGFALRSVALDAQRRRVAAVAGNGRRLYLASDRGSTSASTVRTPVAGTDLLRPVFDRFGRLWTVDRTSRGAVVHVVTGGRDRVLQVPGLSGKRISAFTVTRDGARLVATLAAGATPVVLVGEVVRSEVGEVRRVTGVSTVDVGEADLGPAIDVAQNSATTVAVLVQSAPRSGQVLTVELDGSPGDPSNGPEVVPGVLRALVASPDPNDPLRVLTTRRELLGLNDSGQWVASPNKFLSAAYVG